MPCRLISFLTTYEAFLACSSAGVYFRMGVATGVTSGTWSVRVLLAVTAVRKVSPYIRNRCLKRRIISRVTYLLPRVVAGPIRVSVTLL